MKLKRDDQYLAKTIETICSKRGIKNYLDKFTMSKVKINGETLQLATIEVEKPKGVIIFTPGTNAYALLYGEYLTALAEEGYKVVGYDPRCHGQSSGENGSYTIPELVDDLYELSHLFYKKEKLPIILTGSSQGGIVSFYCAAKEQKIALEQNRNLIIKGIICHNIADLSDDRSVELTRFPAISKIFKKSLTELSKILPEVPLSMELYLNLRIEPVKNMGNAWKIIQQDPLLPDTVRLKTLASLGNTPLPLPIEKLKTPLFLIQAGNDTIFRTDYSQWLFDKLNCPKKMVIYDGLPHYMIVDYVDEFIGDISEWLKDLEKE